MKKLNDFEYQRLLREWLPSFEWRNPISVTLNLKQGLIHLNGAGSFITDEIADGTIQTFLNRLNRKFYSSIQTRKGIGIQRFVVMEHGFENDRKHYHLLIDWPADQSLDEVEKTITKCWSGLTWAHGQHVQRADMGWAEYITKLETKPDFQEAIRWQLCKRDP